MEILRTNQIWLAALQCLFSEGCWKSGRQGVKVILSNGAELAISLGTSKYER